MIVIENLSELLLSTRLTLFVTGKLVSSQMSAYYFISQVVVYSMSTMVCLLMEKKFDIIAIILNVIDFEKVTNVKVSHSYYILSY